MANRFIQPGARGNKKRSSKPSKNAGNHGKVVQLAVQSLSHDGRGVASYQGKTGFVSGGLPGELLDVRLTADHSRYWEGQVVKVLTAAEDRVEPFCRYYGQCGGCDLQHMAYPAQLSAKQEAVLDRLQRFADLQPEELAPPLSLDDRGYRLRTRVSLSKPKKGSKNRAIGFRSRSSQALVDIEQCPIFTQSLDSLYQKLRECLPTLSSFGAIGHVWLVEGEKGVSLVLRCTQSLPDEDRAQLQQLVSDQTELEGVYLQREKQGGLFSLSGTSVSPRLNYPLIVEFPGSASEDGLPHTVDMAFHPLDFIQSNRQINGLMVSQALSWLAPKESEVIVDLFSGIGNFTLPLSLYCQKVVGIEGSDEMVQRCLENAALNQQTNVRCLQADLSAEDPLAVVRQVLKTEKVDAMLLDPPRAGAESIVRSLLVESKRSKSSRSATGLPGRILYISCDASTFARDAAILKQSGYRLARLGVMDMFPQTAHIETMGLFLR